MIADEGLRALFNRESGDYLQRLDDGLLRMERYPDDNAAVEEVFRAAHSLKGAAHMLGLDTLEILAHSLEEMFNAARRDVEARSLEHVKEMLRQLADIRSSVAHALTTAETPKAVLPSAGCGDAWFAAPAGAGSIAVGPKLAAVAPDAPASDTPPAPFTLDAVRIDSCRLDALLNFAGELTVARTCVSRRLADIDAIVDHCEDLRRDAMRGFCVDARHTLALLERLGPIDAMLARLSAALGDDCARLDIVSGELNAGIREMRLLPLANIFRQFPRMVQELARSQGKAVELVIEGADASADKRILEEVRDPLMHVLRNAVDHGIEPVEERERAGKPATGRICMRARRTESAVEIEISDDGRGLDEGAISLAALQAGLESEASLAAMTRPQVWSLIFRPGLTTTQRVTDVSGRGIGLDVVRESVERLKGTVALDSAAGRGLVLRLRLPVTLVTARVLIVQIDRCPYGIPVEQVLGARRVVPDDVLKLEGRDAMLFEGAPLPLAALEELLERPAPKRDVAGGRTALILTTAQGRFGILVDALLDEQEVVLKPQSGLLERVRNVAGATILDSGAICMVLDPQDLFASLRRHGRSAHETVPVVVPAGKKRVLLAEDSIITRTQECRILTDAGYEVITAVDGLDALHKLAREKFDAIVTDVNMPNLNGLELARRIRCEARYAHLPVILVTSLESNEDRMRGLEAGANAYITKPAFDQRDLIECLERLI